MGAALEPESTMLENKQITYIAHSHMDALVRSGTRAQHRWHTTNQCVMTTHHEHGDDSRGPSPRHPGAL